MIIPTSRQTAWGNNGTFQQVDRSRARNSRRRRGKKMFQGHIDRDTAIPVEASANGDVLFDLAMLYASGRSGPVDLVAAHKWFNLAALKGRVDAIALRRA